MPCSIMCAIRTISVVLRISQAHGNPVAFVTLRLHPVAQFLLSR